MKSGKTKMFEWEKVKRKNGMEGVKRQRKQIFAITRSSCVHIL